MTQKNVSFAQRKIPVIAQVDLCVVGGGTAGCRSSYYSRQAGIVNFNRRAQHCFGRYADYWLGRTLYAYLCQG